MYDITYILCNPGKGLYTDDLNLDRIMGSGDSLLESVQHEVFEVKMQAWARDQDHVVTFACNTDHRVSRALICVQAQSFQDAERKGYDSVAPLLSYWSYRYDVALDVLAHEVLERETRSTKRAFGAAGRIKPLDFSEGFLLPPELRRLFAAYREALSTTNVFYSVLSFYKVLEGVARLRNEHMKRAREKGESPRGPVERFPDDVQLIPDDFWNTRERFTPYLGKKITSVKEEFRPLIRNAVAHLNPMETTGDVMDADRFDDLERCREAWHILKYMARRLLDTAIGETAAAEPPATSGGI
ncbi:MAG: hypothetical protein Q8R28_12600 [Dehalococcoidia bacterium]|nr:hypothetical protein [Dehalococcoidia bacterium]